MNSQQRRANDRGALGSAADILSEEIRQGEWDHISSIRSKPIVDCSEIIQELEQRCPDYTQKEYQNAIARSMWMTR